MRMPSLDGLRAVSIVFVLLAHVAGTAHAPAFFWPEAGGDIGRLGVQVFFVISGFLMTRLLERPLGDDARFSPTAFLQRRVRRIVPAFGVYVAAMALASATGLIALRPRDLLTAATFTMNYHADRAWYLGHLWSLSVEAQFYVLWAATRALVGRAGMLWAALAGLALGPVTRVAVHVLAPDWRWSIGEALPTVIDALAAGALLAVLHDTLTRNGSYLALLRSKALALLPVPVLALNAAMPYLRFSYPVGQTLMNLLIAVLMHRLMLFPDSAAGRFLNHRAIVGVGAMSYSLYLWQQPFLNRTSASPAAAFPVNLALALAAAFVSYRLAELPAQRVAVRATKPATGHLERHGPGAHRHAA
jgi:peptidoglycan/LPS O-acetylase OafA/YrhL